MRIGRFTIDPVRDGRGFEVSDALTRPGIDDPWACHRDALDEHARIVFEMGGFLLRDGERVILVDTGVGSFQTDGLQTGAFLDSLAGLGVRPEDVTDVLLTHLHYDHVGWATSKGQVVFGTVGKDRPQQAACAIYGTRTRSAAIFPINGPNRWNTPSEAQPRRRPGSRR